jgi:hypothetical protein
VFDFHASLTLLRRKYSGRRVGDNGDFTYEGEGNNHGEHGEELQVWFIGGMKAGELAFDIYHCSEYNGRA